MNTPYSVSHAINNYFLLNQAMHSLITITRTWSQLHSMTCTECANHVTVHVASYMYIVHCTVIQLQLWWSCSCDRVVYHHALLI